MLLFINFIRANSKKEEKSDTERKSNQIDYLETDLKQKESEQVLTHGSFKLEGKDKPISSSDSEDKDNIQGVSITSK